MGSCISKQGEKQPILYAVDIETEAPISRSQFTTETYEYDPNNPPAIKPQPGFLVELGCSDIVGLQQECPLEQQDRFDYFYRKNFETREHINYIGGTISTPIVISIQTDKSLGELKAIVRTPKLDSIVTLPKDIVRSKLLSYVQRTRSELHNVSFKEVKDPSIVRELVHMEERLISKNHKFGIVYSKEGQMDENDMFSNAKGSLAFDNFLNLLGDCVRLKGFKGYRGELDVENDSTGTHSVYTTYQNENIMFHVSTMLPYSSVNNQQVERKSRIGNDVCVIIFQDGATPYNPTTIQSKFNHVFIVVQQFPNGKYRVGVASKQGVKPFGPLLPKDGLFDHGQELKNFLLAKLINGERGAFSAPSFNQTRTRRDWLKGILTKYG